MGGIHRLRWHPAKNERNDETQTAEATSYVGQPVAQCIVLQVLVHVSVYRNNGDVIAGGVGVCPRFQGPDLVVPDVVSVPFGAIHFFHGHWRTFLVN